MALLLSSYRGRVKLYENGYLYVLDKVSANGKKKFWRCERKYICNARLHVDTATNQIIKRASEHNHPSNSHIVRGCGSNPINSSGDPIAEAFMALTEQARLDGEVHNVPVETVRPRGRGRKSLNASTTSAASTSAKTGLLKKKRKKSKKDGNQGVTKSRKKEHADSPGPSSNCEISNIKREVVGESCSGFNVTSGFEDISNDDLSVQQPVQHPVEQPMLPRCPSRNRTNYGCVERFFDGGLVTWCPKISEIIQLGEMLVKMVSLSNATNYVSLLLTGAPNSGKSCLGALIAKHSDIPVFQLCTPDDMVGFSETEKATALRKTFEEAYKSTISVIMLDNIDRLIDYSPNGNQFSNLILQSLYLLLKKAPPVGCRVFLVATSEERCVQAFELRSFFTFSTEVPLLTDFEHLMAVIDDSDVFDDQQRTVLRQLLVELCANCSIGIKTLLNALELTRQCDHLHRVVFFYQKLQDLISSM